MAVLVLKRLSDAVRNGDVIRAVIRGSGSNQDGHTPGITQPNSKSQEDLIRSVYRSAQLDFTSTRYVEAHGTCIARSRQETSRDDSLLIMNDQAPAPSLGTRPRLRPLAESLGLPVPLETLFICEYLNSKLILLFSTDCNTSGSVKTNIGHLEGASALAGILKSILILEKGLIPPNALFEKLNPKINAKFNNLQVCCSLPVSSNQISESMKVPTSCIPWPKTGLRRISINCFGFGGSNGHLVLDDAFHTLEALSISTLTHIPASFSYAISTNSQKTNGTTDRDQITEAPVHGKLVSVTSSAEDGGEVGIEAQTGLLQCSNENSTNGGPSVKDSLAHNSSDATRASKGDQTLETTKLSPTFQLLVWSAKDEAGLKRMLQAYSQYCEKNASHPERFIGQLAYTLCVRRSLMSWRSFAIVSNQAVTDSIEISPVKPARSFQNPGGLAFVFTGQGAQYAKMGLGLCVYPVFKSTLSHSSNIIRDLGADWSLFGEKNRYAIILLICKAANTN